MATQDQLVGYFSDIAAAVDIPIVLYDNPVLTKNPLQPETVAEVRRKIPTVAGIKVSDQDCIKLQTLLNLVKDDPGFPVLTGSEFLIVVAMQMGCAGFVGGLHNICPDLAVALYESFRAGDVERARQLQQDIIATWNLFRYGNIWGAFDEALRYLGIWERATGKPYVTQMSEGNRQAVRNILDAYVKPYLRAPVER